MTKKKFFDKYKFCIHWEKCGLCETEIWDNDVLVIDDFEEDGIICRKCFMEALND